MGKTIMLVGATGSGKSTLVDGMVNYVMGVSFDDPFRFTIVQLEEEEKKTHNQVIVIHNFQLTIFFISIYPFLRKQINSSCQNAIIPVKFNSYDCSFCRQYLKPNGSQFIKLFLKKVVD